MCSSYSHICKSQQLTSGWSEQSHTIYSSLLPFSWKHNEICSSFCSIQGGKLTPATYTHATLPVSGRWPNITWGFCLELTIMLACKEQKCSKMMGIIWHGTYPVSIWKRYLLLSLNINCSMHMFILLYATYVRAVIYMNILNTESFLLAPLLITGCQKNEESKLSQSFAWVYFHLCYQLYAKDKELQITSPRLHTNGPLCCFCHWAK